MAFVNLVGGDPKIMGTHVQIVNGESINSGSMAIHGNVPLAIS